MSKNNYRREGRTWSHGDAPVHKRLARPVATISDSYSWYVVRTNIKCEERADRGMRSIGVATYVPILLTQRFYRGRRERHERPALSRYIFAGLDPVQPAFGLVRDVQGVESLIGMAGEPICVPAAALRILDEGLAIGDPEPESLIGQTMVIRDGHPFAGFFAAVTGVMSGDRVRAIIRAFGSATIEIPIDNLRAA